MNAICKAYVLSHEKCKKPYVLLNIRVTLHENMITKKNTGVHSFKKP